MRGWPRATAILNLALTAALLPSPDRADHPPSSSIPPALGKATKWLTSQQNPDGGYGPFGEKDRARVKDASDVGITAFALHALAKDPRRPRDPAWPPVASSPLTQDAEGFWKNTSERWFEEIPVLATSFVVVALVECESSLSRSGSRSDK